MSTKEKKVSTDEKILVVPAKKMFSGIPVTGFYPLKNFDYYVNLITTNKEFLWRSDMEQNPSYKQIIPYLIFNYENKYFVMQRKATASEQRLKNKYTLGIGGHVRQEDIEGKDLISWAQREFNEEIDYHGHYEIQPLGIINDESNDVGRVHTGFAFLLKGDSAAIRVRSELKEGNLLTLEECEQRFPNMETWSQLAFNFLKKLND